MDKKLTENAKAWAAKNEKTESWFDHVIRGPIDGGDYETGVWYNLPGGFRMVVSEKNGTLVVDIRKDKMTLAQLDLTSPKSLLRFILDHGQSAGHRVSIGYLSVLPARDDWDAQRQLESLCWLARSPKGLTAKVWNQMYVLAHRVDRFRDSFWVVAGRPIFWADNSQTVEIVHKVTGQRRERYLTAAGGDASY